jgi:membrane-associated protein
VVFCETGLVVTPFWPGDSLLFAAGAISADPTAGLSPLVCISYLRLSQFWVIRSIIRLAPALVSKFLIGNLPFVKREYLDRANEFYAKHGAKMIVLARFVPIVRTFAPFAAGIAKMDYKTFITYNVIGRVILDDLVCLGWLFLWEFAVCAKEFRVGSLGDCGYFGIAVIYEWMQSRRKSV